MKSKCSSYTLTDKNTSVCGSEHPGVHIQWDQMAEVALLWQRCKCLRRVDLITSGLLMWPGSKFSLGGKRVGNFYYFITRFLLMGRLGSYIPRNFPHLPWISMTCPNQNPWLLKDVSYPRQTFLHLVVFKVACLS